MSPQRVRLFISVREEAPSKEVRWEQLSRHPGYIQSTRVQLYCTGCPGTPPLCPSSWFSHTCTSCSPWPQMQGHWWRYPPASFSVQREGGKLSQRPDPWACCLPVSGWLLRWTGQSQWGQTHHPPPRKGDAVATEKTWHYCTPLAKTELWEFWNSGVWPGLWPDCTRVR